MRQSREVGAMDGMWYKRCPQCGNYMKKQDPQESAMCCACGWEEYIKSFFCAIGNDFCTRLTAEGALALSRQAPLDRRRDIRTHRKF